MPDSSADTPADTLPPSDAPADTVTAPDARVAMPVIPTRPAIHLDHCVIHVSDWARANAFYRDVLGAEIVERGGGYAYRFGGVQLNCHGPGLAPEPVAALPVMPGGSDLCFRWPGTIEEVLAHLQALGVPVERGPVERHGAAGEGVSVYFRDPDGSLMEFITYPV